MSTEAERGILFYFMILVLRVFTIKNIYNRYFYYNPNSHYNLNTHNALVTYRGALRPHNSPKPSVQTEQLKLRWWHRPFTRTSQYLSCTSYEPQVPPMSLSSPISHQVFIFLECLSTGAKTTLFRMTYNLIKRTKYLFCLYVFIVIK